MDLSNSFRTLAGFPSRQSGRTWLEDCLAAALLAALASASGCYQSESLVNKARSAAQRTHMAEVDLGTYRTTMPTDPETNSLTELTLHLFGNVPRYRVPTIERQLKTDEYRIRHEMIAAVREATVDELAEPDLTQLRTRLEKVMNKILAESPVDSIVFYSMAVNYRSGRP